MLRLSADADARVASASAFSTLPSCYRKAMTYCVAIKLNAGLVFLPDSRTNAGLDHISTFRKIIEAQRHKPLKKITNPFERLI